MNEIEIRERIINLKEELNSLIANAEGEKRELNDDENKKMTEIRTEIDGLNGDLEKIQEENKRALEALKNDNKNKKEVKRMKLINLINDVINNRSFDEATATEMAEARSEMAKSGIAAKGQIVLRSIQATVATKGQENVPEEKESIELALRNNLVATKMGASFLGGLVGDVSIPTYDGSTVKWKGEIASADNGQGTFGEVTLTPHRLTAYLDISKQFLLQDSNDAEAMLLRDLSDAIREKLDGTIFGGIDVSTEADAPAKIYDTSNTTSVALASAAYADVLGLEEKIEEKNGQDYMFLTSPKAKFTFKGIQRGKGLDVIYKDGELDGYTTISSNSVEKGATIALDPKSLVIAQWGGIDVTVDPYSKAADGQIRLVINAYFDAKMKSDRIWVLKYTE